MHAICSQSPTHCATHRL
uniref:Uncharacterized protein n=1 Tax=Anguilla anguilla TaxID=7936 RepID=A0A0E9Q588_ANGAN